MLTRPFGRINEEQRGITGLETAIILIAFVMVASIFSYVVVTAGLFSTQKAREAVNAGINQSRAAVELKGNVIAKLETGVVTTIYLTIGLVPSGASVDITDTTDQKNQMIISYADVYHQYPGLDWKAEIVNANNGDKLLDAGELAQITIDLKKVNDGASGPTEKLGAYGTFVIEVKPPDGPVLTVERTIPARVSNMLNLY